MQESKFASGNDFTDENLQRDKLKMNNNAATMNDPRASVTGTSSLVNIDKNIYYKDVALIRYNPDEQGESLV